jgi:hypothetical protein
VLKNKNEKEKSVKKKKVIDIGAGLNPDRRTTHVIDNFIFPKERRIYKKRGIKHAEMNIYDVTKYPKLKNQFDTIVSKNAIGGDPRLTRVSLGNKLKYLAKDKNSRVEITTGNLNSVNRVKEIIRKGGFKIKRVTLPKTRFGSAKVIGEK